MNAKKSDKFIQEWTNQAKPLSRAIVTCEKTFKISPEKLFPLLCPTTEYDWIPIGTAIYYTPIQVMQSIMPSLKPTFSVVLRKYWYILK